MNYSNNYSKDYKNSIMKELTLTNLKPQGDWVSLADYLKSLYNWDKEQEKLIVKLTRKYKLPFVVGLLNELCQLVEKCNNLAGIYVYYEDSLIFQRILTISEGVIEPRMVNEPESLMDKSHIKTFESGEQYLLKIN